MELKISNIVYWMGGGKGRGAVGADESEGVDMRSRYRNEAMHNMGLTACKQYRGRTRSRRYSASHFEMVCISWRIPPSFTSTVIGTSYPYYFGGQRYRSLASDIIRSSGIGRMCFISWPNEGQGMHIIATGLFRHMLVPMDMPWVPFGCIVNWVTIIWKTNSLRFSFGESR